MTLGNLIGFCAGWLFLVILGSLVSEIRGRSQAKKSNMRYTDWLRTTNDNFILRFFKIIYLDGIYSSKIGAIVSYILKVVLLVTILALVVLGVIFGVSDFGDLLDIKL